MEINIFSAPGAWRLIRCLLVGLIMALCFMALSCKKLMPAAVPDEESLDGPLSGLSTAERQMHAKGDVAFNTRVFTAQSGLGPVFVASSCGSCHAGDGKGHPFSTLTRFGQADSRGNHFLDRGGPQLQHRALPGYVPEQIPAGATFSKFMPPANTGLGFIELVPDADILSMSDPNDQDGDGISGVPNWKRLSGYLQPQPGAVSQGGRYIHRFGKKAAVYSLLHQTVNAYNQDMGITSAYEPLDAYSLKPVEPEVTLNEVQEVVFYLQTLKAPLRRHSQNATVMRGELVFAQTGCNACHRETLRTGYSPVDALSYKEFHPYTDLLLHDMGPELDDGYTEGSALTAEWRTAPLWGLGLAPHSQGGSYYLLHDGRAQNMTQAIELHGGEGSASRTKFRSLAVEDKQALIQFLESL